MSGTRRGIGQGQTAAPLTSLGSNSTNTSLLSTSSVSSLNSLSNSGSGGPPLSATRQKKLAWGGAATRGAPQLQSSIVSADGSIMPKPGEVRQTIKSYGGSGSSSASIINTGPVGGSGSAFGSSSGGSLGGSSGWDSRERANRSSAFKTNSKSSIAAAAAAARAAAGKSSMPAGMRSSITSDATSKPNVAPSQSAKPAQASAIGSKGSSSQPRPPKTTSSTSSSNSDPSLAPLSAAAAAHSQYQRNNNASNAKHDGDISSATGSTFSKKSSFGEMGGGPRDKMGTSDRSQGHHSKKTSGGASNASWRSGGPNERSSGPGVMSKHTAVPGRQQPPRFSNSGAAGGQSVNTSNSAKQSGEIARLQRELEKEREAKAALARECTELRSKNSELMTKMNEQDKELSTLRREVHNMENMQRISDSVVGIDHLGLDDAQDSPFLQSLGLVSNNSSPSVPISGSRSTNKSVTTPAAVPSQSHGGTAPTVESLVDDLIEFTLSSFSLDRLLWREAEFLMDDSRLRNIKYRDAVPRPQALFAENITLINSDAPFVPLLHAKQHALEPLNQREISTMPWLNPYRTEIANLVYPPWQLQRPPVIRRNDALDNCPLYFVNQPYQLSQMIQKLAEQPELAVDTEYHSQHSYRGFLCLIQISSRDEDYIIDVLALRSNSRSNLSDLNVLFADPKIVKVLHGADMDVIWLQKDLGCYLVNVFDTGQAARELGYPGFGYSFVLNRFFGIMADKSLQTADWRLRPLPRAMCNYARQDTHFLLDIYDRMRCELLDRNQQLVSVVLRRSALICSQAYAKDTPVSPEKCSALMLSLLRRRQSQGRSCPVIGPIQRECFLALALWRDRVARLRDESPQYILDDESLLCVSCDCPTSLKALQRSFAARQAKCVPALLLELRRYLFWEMANAITNFILNDKNGEHTKGCLGPHKDALIRNTSGSNSSNGGNSNDSSIGFGWLAS